MSVYKVRLTKKEMVADETMAFHFERPSGLNFKAGQYLDYILIDPPQTDNEGNVRSFTIASAPYEDDIVFITRMRDTAFKRIMRDMKIGTEVKFDGPNGNFILKPSEHPAVFLTGGVGITPALSIIKQAVHDNSSQKITLFYSNKTVDSAVAMTELYELTKLDNNFIFIPTISDQNNNNFTGEIGRIDGNLLQKYISDLSKPDYYLAGPPTMVKSLRQTLIDNGVKKQSIFTEDFVGY
jgi:ferredoxin-NADP reductase